MLLDSCSLSRLFEADPRLQKALRYHQHAPRSAIPKDAPHLTLKFHGTAAKLRAEFTGKRPQTAVANLEAYFRYRTLRREHLLCPIHAQPSEEIVRSLAKRGPEKPVEMKLGKTRLPRRLLEQNTGLVLAGEKIASPAKPAKGVVMEQLRHKQIILLSCVGWLR